MEEDGVGEGPAERAPLHVSLVPCPVPGGEGTGQDKLKKSN